MKIAVAGLDPSLRNWGLAKGWYNLENDNLEITGIDLVETANETGKQVRQSSDDIRCAQDLSSRMHAWIGDTTAVFGEVPSGSQSARGMFSNGVCLGVMSSIGIVGAYRGVLTQVTPSEVKRLATGSKHASKDEMIEWAMEKWPELPWVITKSGKNKGQPAAKNEHMADAAAAINAGVQTNDFRNLLQVIRASTNFSQVKN